MTNRRQFALQSAAALSVLSFGGTICDAQEPSTFPPGWLPLQELTDDIVWSDFRKIDDKIHLYLPPGVKTVRGVFICYVFHSADARELARLWQFALVTVPWPFEFDLGVNDKRNGRFKVGHPVGDMSLVLRYLDHAAKKTKHPELAVAPLVGWLGQNGSHLGNDLWKREPKRIIAWSDSFVNRLEQYPEFTKHVPFALAWEYAGQDKKERPAERELKAPQVAGKLTPPSDFRCRANTYGFNHGIYSKFNFFMAYLDRCIRLRLPDEAPPPGEPPKLRSIAIEHGWAGDYNPVSEWNPIAPVRDAKQMISPQWLPDAYAAWLWRSYHSANPNLKLTAPRIEYRKANGKWGGPECGLGYGGYLAANSPLRFAAEMTGSYQQLEYFSGDQSLGVVKQTPWELPDVKLQPGLHALFVVGTDEAGQQVCSRPAFAIVRA